MPDEITSVVNVWFNDTFHNHGPALSSELFSYFRASKEKLILQLLALHEEEG